MNGVRLLKSCSALLSTDVRNTQLGNIGNVQRLSVRVRESYKILHTFLYSLCGIAINKGMFLCNSCVIVRCTKITLRWWQRTRPLPISFSLSLSFFRLTVIGFYVAQTSTSSRWRIQTLTWEESGRAFLFCLPCRLFRLPSVFFLSLPKIRGVSPSPRFVTGSGQVIASPASTTLLHT